MGYDELEDLEIYKIAEKNADMAWKLVEKWSFFEKDTIGKQLVRAISSIGANIAESYGRYHKNDVIRFLLIARGSLYESKYWLKRGKEAKLISDDIFMMLFKEIEGLAPRLNGFIRAKREFGN